MVRRSRWVVVAVALGVVVAAVFVGRALVERGADGGAVDAGPPGMSGPAPSTRPSTAGISTPRVRWERCPRLRGGVDPDTKGLRCAGLRVPLDYADPGGEQIRVVVSRLTGGEDPEARATGRPVLVSNPGGPGATGLFNTLGIDAAAGGRLRGQFDLVGFDPRGVNLSTPVQCQVGDEDVDQLPSGLVAGDLGADLALANRVARGCERGAGELIQHVGTLDAARDLEMLRRAVGVERLSLVGTSYGAELMTTYATSYPDHTGRVVLDSPSDPTVPWVRARRDQAVMAARRTPVVLDRLARPGWSLGGDADDVGRRLTTLLADLDEKPRTIGGQRIDGDSLVQARVLPALGDDRQIEALGHSMQVLLGVPGAPSARSLLRDLDQGSPEPVNGQSLRQQVLASTAIRCADDPWPQEGTVYRRWLNEDRQRAPLTRGSFSRVTPCAAWPRLDRERRPVLTDTGWSGRANILVLHRRDDLRSPIPGLTRLLNALGRRSHLVQRPGASHVLLGTDRTATAAAVRWLDR